MNSRSLLAEFEGNPPASSASIEKFGEESELQLPADYVAFLQDSNGGEGFVGESYAILWSVDELMQFNQEYEIAEYCPGLLLFGSDGGGEAFAFDTRDTPWQVVKVPFVGMDPRHVQRIAGSFGEFLSAIAAEGNEE